MNRIFSIGRIAPIAPIALLLVLALASCKGPSTPATEKGPASGDPASAQSAGQEGASAESSATGGDEGTTKAPATGEEALPSATAEEGISDTALGLAKGSVFDTLEPSAFNPVDVSRDDAEGKGGAFPGGPPVIPHNVADLLPITRQGEHPCLECHDSLPKSHYTDLRNAPEKVTDKLAGARYICVSCHVPQTNAPPLVANTF